jgi:hypothetical protein
VIVIYFIALMRISCVGLSNKAAISGTQAEFLRAMHYHYTLGGSFVVSSVGSSALGSVQFSLNCWFRLNC